MPVSAQQIIESLPGRLRPEKSAAFQGIVHFDITGDAAVQYTVQIDGDKCNVSKGLHGSPACIIKTSAATYVGLETGKINPQNAYLMGKIKVSDISALTQFTKCFRKFAEQEANSQTASIVTRPKISGPLSGVKIIDFTRLLPGPLATMFLADMGADVIKVEDPDNPDYIRNFPPFMNGISAYYLALNRNKRSLAVNYLSAGGKKMILDLISSADVLVEQYRPGVMKEMGFGYQALSQINPRLVYVSVTGYGQQSSMANKAGHDLNYIATAGALQITRDAEGNPVIPGYQLADIAGGSYMAMNAVLAALYQREKTGKGNFVDVSMTDAVVPFSVLQFAKAQTMEKENSAAPFELSGGLANYNVYACADGKYIAMGSLEPKFWSQFCAKVGRTEWTKVTIHPGPEEEQLKREVREFFATRSSAEWQELFKNEDICFTVINSMSDLAGDKYLNERKMFIDTLHPVAGNYKTISQPLKFEQHENKTSWPAPDLGHDTLAILKELNYTDEQIANLRTKNTVKT